MITLMLVCFQMVNVNWLFFFSKIIELADTVSTSASLLVTVLMEFNSES